MTHRLSFVLLFLLALACDGPSTGNDAGPDSTAPQCAPADPGEPRALFVLPREASVPFFDLPFPNDIRRTASGTVDFSGFPRSSTGLVARYVAAISQRLTGFGTHGAIYVRFSHSVAQTSLPSTPEASIAPGASVFLMDIDSASAELGRLHPIVVHYQECQTRYWSAHTLALRPVYGLPLASGRRYAAVVTRGVLPEGGGSFARDADFEALATGGGDAAVEAARARYGDVFTVLANEGVAIDDVIALSVFTTQDAIGETIAVRDWMIDNYPAPTVVAGSLQRVNNTTAMTEITGYYGPSPIFQAGEVPYVESGGAIELTDGVPTVHGQFNARFTLTVPSTDMPTEGYPIVLYAHGTGGSHHSFVNDETGARLAAIGFAAMGIDQIHHNERNPTSTDPAILFFNFLNPEAARDNNRQSALDVVQQARLVESLSLPVSLFVDGRSEAVHFNTARIHFMGHSQGGLNGPIFLAIDDTARAAVLSAASGVLTPSLIEKLLPIEIPLLVMTFLGLSGATWQEAFATEGFTVEHPAATLVQTWIEAADGANYAHMIFASPREGFAPKSVLMTEGLMDEYSPPASIEALAGAMRVPQITPVHRELDSLRLLGITPLDPGMSGNVAGGMATAGLLQFPDDGHFAVFRNATATRQVFGFFGSLTPGAVGTIPAP